jgi:hypothetical protein
MLHIKKIWDLSRYLADLRLICLHDSWYMLCRSSSFPQRLRAGALPVRCQEHRHIRVVPATVRATVQVLSCFMLQQENDTSLDRAIYFSRLRLAACRYAGWSINELDNYILRS